MGMVKAALSLTLGLLLSLDALAVRVAPTVFGVTERTPYCAFDRQAGVYTVGFWLQDFSIPLAPNHNLILRYTTVDENHPDFNNYSGVMSVYEELGDSVNVLAEYRIRSDKLGNPILVDGIQEYAPKAPFSPAEISPLRVPYVTPSFGSYTYCPVPRNVFTNLPEGSTCLQAPVQNAWYRYVVSVTSNGSEVHVIELYWQSHTTNDYARLMVYNTADVGRTLVRVYDYPTDTNYYRYRTVTNGICTDRY